MPKMSRLWEPLHGIVYNTAMECLGPSTRKHKDWFNENCSEIKQLLEEKHWAYRATLMPPSLQPSWMLYRVSTAPSSRNCTRCSTLVKQQGWQNPELYTQTDMTWPSTAAWKKFTVLPSQVLPLPECQQINTDQTRKPSMRPSVRPSHQALCWALWQHAQLPLL